MIFISYCWHDRDHAERLCRDLKAAAHPYWLDSEQLDVESPLLPQIIDGVRRASAVLFLDTSASRRSMWVECERSLATWMSKPTLVLGFT